MHQQDCKIFNATNGLVQTWYNLEPGIYAVAETPPSGIWTGLWDISIPAYQHRSSGRRRSAGVTNTFKPGTLAVTKTVNWNGVPEDNTKTFEICIHRSILSNDTEL